MADKKKTWSLMAEATKEYGPPDSDAGYFILMVASSVTGKPAAVTTRGWRNHLDRESSPDGSS
jgi:hypothetical protein